MSSYFPNRWPLSYLNLTKNMKTYIRRHKEFILKPKTASLSLHICLKPPDVRLVHTSRKDIETFEARKVVLCLLDQKLKLCQIVSYFCHSLQGFDQGQGQHRVMIYINFVELPSLMLHTKFQNHRPSGSGEEDFLKFFFLFIAMAAILVM